MKILNQNEVGKVWLEYLEAVLTDGELTPDDREEVLEIGPVVFQISTFSDEHGILERNADPHVIDIYTKKMFSMELIEELNSTYGDRFFNNLGVDQVSWAIERLSKNPWAKSCFIPLVIPDDPGPRIPCLSAVQLAIRNEHLKVYATFRSQNVMNAYGNFLGLYAFANSVSEQLNVPFQEAYFFVNFPHIYSSDIDRARAVVECEKAMF